MNKGLWLFAVPRYNKGDTELLFDMVKELYFMSLSVSKGGSVALDLCMIDSGSYMANQELYLQPYDYTSVSSCIISNLIELDLLWQV